MTETGRADMSEQTYNGAVPFEQWARAMEAKGMMLKRTHVFNQRDFGTYDDAWSAITAMRDDLCYGCRWTAVPKQPPAPVAEREQAEAVPRYVASKSMGQWWVSDGEDSLRVMGMHSREDDALRIAKALNLLDASERDGGAE